MAYYYYPNAYFLNKSNYDDYDSELSSSSTSSSTSCSSCSTLKQKSFCKANRNAEINRILRKQLRNFDSETRVFKKCKNKLARKVLLKQKQEMAPVKRDSNETTHNSKYILKDKNDWRKAKSASYLKKKLRFSTKAPNEKKPGLLTSSERNYNKYNKHNKSSSRTDLSTITKNLPSIGDSSGSYFKYGECPFNKSKHSEKSGDGFVSYRCSMEQESLSQITDQNSRKTKQTARSRLSSKRATLSDIPSSGINYFPKYLSVERNNVASSRVEYFPKHLKSSEERNNASSSRIKHCPKCQSSEERNNNKSENRSIPDVNNKKIEESQYNMKSQCTNKSQCRKIPIKVMKSDESEKQKQELRDVAKLKFMSIFPQKEPFPSKYMKKADTMAAWVTVDSPTPISKETDSKRRSRPPRLIMSLRKDLDDLRNKQKCLCKRQGRIDKCLCKCYYIDGFYMNFPSYCA